MAEAASTITQDPLEVFLDSVVADLRQESLYIGSGVEAVVAYMDEQEAQGMPSGSYGNDRARNFGQVMRIAFDSVEKQLPRSWNYSWLVEGLLAKYEAVKGQQPVDWLMMAAATSLEGLKDSREVAHVLASVRNSRVERDRHHKVAARASKTTVRAVVVNLPE